MNNRLAQNILNLRRKKGLTQEQLAGMVNVSFQTVSKWENDLSNPDVSLLPMLAAALDTDINGLIGYVYDSQKNSLYEDAYARDEYYWGLAPSTACYRVMEERPPVRRYKLLDIGCGEGKDAVFFARNGYDVTAFDTSEAGLEKARRLAERQSVPVNFIKADLLTFRLDTAFDIIYSSGVLHFILPESRDEILANYRDNTNPGGLHALNVFVRKPFIALPPDHEPDSEHWVFGELFTHYADWRILHMDEIIFDCDSSGILHKHCMDTLIAEKPE